MNGLQVLHRHFPRSFAPADLLDLVGAPSLPGWHRSSRAGHLGPRGPRWGYGLRRQCGLRWHREHHPHGLSRTICLRIWERCRVRAVSSLSARHLHANTSSREGKGRDIRAKGGSDRNRLPAGALLVGPSIDDGMRVGVQCLASGFVRGRDHLLHPPPCIVRLSSLLPPSNIIRWHIRFDSSSPPHVASLRLSFGSGWVGFAFFWSRTLYLYPPLLRRAFWAVFFGGIFSKCLFSAHPIFLPFLSFILARGVFDVGRGGERFLVFFFSLCICLCSVVPFPPSLSPSPCCSSRHFLVFVSLSGTCVVVTGREGILVFFGTARVVDVKSSGSFSFLVFFQRVSFRLCWVSALPSSLVLLVRVRRPLFVHRRAFPPLCSSPCVAPFL